MRAFYESMCTAILALLAVAAHQAAAGDDDKASQFINCFVGNNCLGAERTAWGTFLGDSSSCLVAPRAWWSAKPAGLPVTLVTQLSVARLGQLRAQCSTWRGPLAAAVYLPLVNPTPDMTSLTRMKLLEALRTVDQFFQKLDTDAAIAATGCQLRLVLMYELFADPRAASLLYPVNSLRNYARLMADTDLIANIDVDLLPSTSISAALADPQILAGYTESCRRGAAFVLPAFQTHCNGTAYADGIALGGRQALQEGLRTRHPDGTCVTIFEHKYPHFHGPTMYDRWLATSESYKVQYRFFYEPWYLSWRATTPWFDVRYRGYGYNKCAQAAAMNATGATWFVSPHGFLVHRPHEFTHMRKNFVHVLGTRKQIQDLRSTMYGHVTELWQGAVTSLNTTGRLEVRVEESFGGCMASLPWWSNERKEPGAAAAVSGTAGGATAAGGGGAGRRRLRRRR